MSLASLAVLIEELAHGAARYQTCACHRFVISIGMMAPKKHKWDSGFRETLGERKAKEDAEYLARVQARADAIKRALDGQVKKDRYKKVMREWADLAKRDSITTETHKERIQFLEKVLKENLEWRAGTKGPLQLKLNLIELQAKIGEMREYVAARVKGGRIPSKPRAAALSARKTRELTSEQVIELYERAKSKILRTHGRTVERLSKNVHDGLPIERARERLLAQGVTIQVVDTFNEVVKERNLVFSEGDKNAIKLFLLNPERLGSFIDGMIEDIESH